MQQTQTLHPKDLYSLPKDAVILDVRSKEEHAVQRLTLPHIHVPMEKLSAKTFLQDNNVTHKTPLYVVCGSGKRAPVAAQLLREGGFNEVFAVEGGLRACADRGESMVHEKARSSKISHAGQMRVTLGFFIKILSLFSLGGVTQLLWGLLAIGVGCMLCDSTAYRALTRIWAKAPWNR